MNQTCQKSLRAICQKPFRVFALFSLSILLTAVLFALTGNASAETDTVPAYSAHNNGRPYYICVNRAASTVTVYGLDDNGYYTVPVKAMICSTGRAGHATPVGTFSITGVKKTWCYMVDGTYGQYSSQFRGNYLFHSICYRKASPDTMLTDEYNALGGPASRGCVRLQVEDAKWIYDNCAAGTKVTIYDDASFPGPLGQPPLAVSWISPDLDNGWDPTDPRENNPWRARMASGFSLTDEILSMQAGERQSLPYALEPPDAVLPRVNWTSDNPSIASVDASGRVTALSAGTAVITGTCGTFSDTCTVTVRGELLPFSDIPPGMWNYNDIRYVYENGILGGGTAFSPDACLTWADMLQCLYNLAGTLPVTPGSPADLERAWYHNALQWAKEYSLIGIDGKPFEPGKAVTRTDFALLLFRYDTLYLGYASGIDTLPTLDAYTDVIQRSESADSYDGESANISGETTIDSESVDSNSNAAVLDKEAANALRWAVGNGIMTGSAEGILDPDGLTTRSHAAVLLHRYSQMGHDSRLVNMQEEEFALEAELTLEEELTLEAEPYMSVSWIPFRVLSDAVTYVKK